MNALAGKCSNSLCSTGNNKERQTLFAVLYILPHESPAIRCIFAPLKPELPMKANFSDIKPYEGLGNLSFGADRETVKALLGDPVDTERFSLDEEEGGDTEAWHYDEDGLSISFDEDHGWMLTSIAVSTPEYTLEGVALIGKSLENVKSIFEQKDWGTLDKDEEFEDDGSGSQLYFVEDQNMSLWFENDSLTELQWNGEAEEDEEED